MAQDNVELVKGGFAAYAERGVEGMLEFTAPDFELTTPPSLASEPDTYRGEAGLRRYFDSFFEAMDSVELDGHEFFAVGDRVVVDFTLRARGRTTGIEAEQHAFMVWTLDGAMAHRLEIFPSKEEAISAAQV